MNTTENMYLIGGIVCLIIAGVLVWYFFIHGSKKSGYTPEQQEKVDAAAETWAKRDFYVDLNQFPSSIDRESLRAQVSKALSDMKHKHHTKEEHKIKHLQEIDNLKRKIKKTSVKDLSDLSQKFEDTDITYKQALPLHLTPPMDNAGRLPPLAGHTTFQNTTPVDLLTNIDQSGTVYTNDSAQAIVGGTRQGLAAVL